MCKLLKTSRQRAIFRNGLIVWGHIIQANGALFFPGDPDDESDDSAPGELVFSTDTTGQVNPEYLARVAQQLKALKHTTPADPQLRAIADYLTEETVRVFGWDAPQQFSPHVPCYISTTMFMRKHLPDGYLQSRMLPLVITQTSPHYAMPLPVRYWPPDFASWVASEAQ
jgi:hypothetical protein